MPTTVPTLANDPASDAARRRQLLHVSADTAIVATLCCTMLSLWAYVAVAGALSVALLLDAVISLQQPERNALALRAIAAGAVASSLVASDAFCMR